MIALLEPLSEGAEHSPFNGAMLEVVGLAYPDEPLAFFGSGPHIAEVRAMLDPALIGRTAWHPVQLPPRRSTTAQRLWSDARLLKHVADQVARSDPGGIVLSLQAVAPILLAAALGRRSGLIGVRVQAILHGYLNQIVGWRSRNPFRRAIELRTALSLAIEHVTLIALEAGVREVMLDIMPSVGARLETLRHPLPVLNTTYPTMTYVAGAPVRFGFLGLATPEKGFDIFLDAARRLKPKYGPAIEFHAIGRSPAARQVCDPKDVGVLSTWPTRGPVPRLDFDKRVAELHYVCVPFSTQHYTLSPSGSLLDALAHTKPVLASATPSTRELFEQSTPGVLLDHAEDLAPAIEATFERLSPELYERQAEAMRRASARRNPRRLAEDYSRFTGPRPRL